MINLGIKNPSKYQVAIFNHVAEQIARMQGDTSIDQENLIIQAVAGSGKTTSLVALARLVPSTMNAIFLAFNKTVATELATRLPSNVPAKTLNALGHAIWGSYIRSKYRRQINLDTNKVWGIIKNVVPKQHSDLAADIKWLVAQAKANGVVPAGYNNAVSANGTQDTPDFWRGVLSHFGRTITDKKGNDMSALAINYARKVLIANLNDEINIDFDDQMYMSVVKLTDYGSHIPVTEYDFLMVDETQDLNTIQRVLISRVVKKDGLIVLVGDRNQSIYGFRGSDMHSMHKLQQEFNCVELPLSICYRCGSKIVAHAQEIVPEIEAAPNAIEGEVITLDSYDASIFKPHDLIICRNNAPLIIMAYKLIRNRVKCKVLGREIGTELNSLIGKLAYPNDGLDKLAHGLNDWLNNQIKIIAELHADNEDKFAAEKQKIEDKYECIKVFIDSTVSTTVGQLMEEIKEMFTDKADEGIVTLSTIHKAKGGEADTVYHLNSDIMFPHWIKPDTWQYQQERHTSYVATTRARKALVYISTKGFN